MKKVLALVLACSLLLSSCGQKPQQQPTPEEETPFPSGSNSVIDITTPSHEEVRSLLAEFEEEEPDYPDLNDLNLLRYLEDSIYSEVVGSLNNSDYFVENVSAVYISKEYLEELSYNSKMNIFFGYTLAELDEQFQGSKYVFTLGDNNETTVEPFEGIPNPYDQVLKNILVGSGIILVCVTISAVAATSGAPAVSMIFAMSAKTGTAAALSGAAFGGISAGILTGMQTGNMDTALEAAAIQASENFKWGAITGAIAGGATEAVALKGATLHGLTMDEAAIIQKESKYPLDVIKEFSNIDQYYICQDAGLEEAIVNGRSMLIRDIDLNYVDDFGRTNLDRMQQGLAALDPATGNSYQLHHIGQRTDSTLAILTEAEHMQGGNNSIWHELGKATEVHGSGNNWDVTRQAIWKALANSVS